MPRVLAVAAALLSIGAVLVMMGVSWVGSFRTDPLIPLFTNPDGSRCEMPCLFGIRPGITTMGEAMKMVEAHPLTYNLRLFIGDFTGTPTSRYGQAFVLEDSSVLYLGQGGQAIVLQVYQDRYAYAPNSVNDDGGIL